MLNSHHTETHSLMTVPELAQRWRVEKHWIYKNLGVLGLPTLRLGRSIRFSLEDVASWEQQNSGARK